MSGHGENPIFFNKENKDWIPLRLITSHFDFTPHSLKSGRHICITPLQN